MGANTAYCAASWFPFTPWASRCSFRSFPPSSAETIRCSGFLQAHTPPPPPPPLNVIHSDVRLLLVISSPSLPCLLSFLASYQLWLASSIPQLSVSCWLIWMRAALYPGIIISCLCRPCKHTRINATKLSRPHWISWKTLWLSLNQWGKCSGMTVDSQ